MPAEIVLRQFPFNDYAEDKTFMEYRNSNVACCKGNIKLFVC